MPDVFITLEEAAAFESVSYKTLTQRIYRNPQQYKTKSQAREGGGKDQVLISTSSLSAKARKAWRAAQKVEGSEVIIDKRAQEAVPWYVTADLNQYTEANKKRFYEAVELAARVQDFIDYDGPDRTGYAERYALGLGISPQSLYRYMKNVLEANAWALKLEKEDGKSRDYFRALALCRKPKETGTFPSLTDEQKAIIENIWFDKRFAANLGTIEMLYERFELEAERREWEEYPSIKTVARYIKFLMGQRGAESARFLAANGTREWKNKRMMKGKRDATSLQVMEYVVGDEHTFDFWVQWTAPNGKIKAVRPKLVAWLDMRSRAIIGDVACVNANSQTLKESLVKMIYSNPGGVPHILHVDNGKDYTAKAMTGQNRKHRKIDLDFAFDSETVGFYHTRKHRGLSDAGEKWVTPIEMFENGPRYEKAAPPREYAAMLLMKAATARVTNQGINKFGTLYTDTELAYYVNQKVNIKWDIDDVTKLYVYDMEGKKICEAVSAELLAFGPHCSQAALEKHLRDQKRNEREVREYLEERVRPYELRLEDGARPSDAVGMIDLTIKATPSQKLVSLPKDRMFRSEQASKTSRKKVTDDTFLNAKGDKALSLLRAMNE